MTKYGANLPPAHTTQEQKNRETTIRWNLGFEFLSSHRVKRGNFKALFVEPHDVAVGMP
jgi:hypothetical protein